VVKTAAILALTILASNRLVQKERTEMNKYVLCLAVILMCSTGVLAQSGNGALKVTSFPSGAQVIVDGVSTGKTTPMSISLTIGEHIVTVSLPNSGWNPDTRPVTIVSGNNDLSVTLLPVVTVGPQGPAARRARKGFKARREIQDRRDQEEVGRKQSSFSRITLMRVTWTL
jgi:hypothetical protein